MASSSSSAGARSIVSSKLYDAFISHRGPDVKQTLGKQLYNLLEGRRCKPFLDCKEIKPGDSITAAIRNAICSSRVQIAIFSKGFAESSWCLDELVFMLQESNTLFIPVFYGVQPWELRHIDQHTDANSKKKSQKKSQYAKAFAEYQRKGRNLDKLDGWKRALESAAGILGYELDQHPEEKKLKEIVSSVVTFVKAKERFTPLYVATYPVGLDEFVQRFESCCPQRAGMVGIFGLGGSGKTTLAKQLFNKKSSGYHKSSFLFNVRESKARGDLHRLQSQLLKDLFDKDESISSVHHGTGKLDEYLRRGRHSHFLIIMDDIDHLDQVNALLPKDMLGRGSLVIITTRDQSVLRGVDARFEMKEMDWRNAKNLFCSHAFRETPTSYQKLVESFVKLCGGLPLSLEVLGGLLYGRKEDYWNQVLDKAKKILPRDIMEKLKISFDSLEEDEKQIFIDIACFFNKEYYYCVKERGFIFPGEKDYLFTETAIKIWKACGWSAELALQTLQDKCLIKIDEYGIFEMHDHLSDLGRQMADKFGPPRLWQSEKAKGFRQTLAEKNGSRYYQSYQDRSLETEFTYFIAETGLVLLEISGRHKTLDKFPSWIPLQKLHYLSIIHVGDLWSSFKEQLRTQHQATSELRTLRILYSPFLPRLPNLREMFRHLEELYINGPSGMTDTTSFVHSLKQLSNLRSLELTDWEGGGNLVLSEGGDSSTSSGLNSLETIKIEGLPNILKLVIGEKMCPKLQKLDIRRMKNLKEIELKSFMKVVDRSPLERIRISDCSELQSVQGMEELSGLKGLELDHTNGWTRKYIGGLRGLPAKQIILGGPDKQASSKLNLSLFSEVIEEAVSEIETCSYPTLKMESSLNVITMYVLHVGDYLCTIVLTEHDSECSLEDTSIVENRLKYKTTVKKGYKVIFKIGEEGKAIMILQRIVDQLYKLNDPKPLYVSYYIPSHPESIELGNVI